MNRSIRRPIAALACFLLIVSSARQANAEIVIVRNDSDLVRSLRTVKPGDSIRIAPGRYRGGLFAARLQGTATQPIRIEAADPDRPPIIEGGSNAFHFSEIAHVTIESLTIMGSQFNGLNIDDGGNAGQTSHHVVLKNLTVRNIGAEGNHDGLKLSGLQDFEIEGCDLSRWGRGGSAIDMVGCLRGKIRGCVFRGRESDMGNGVQAKGGSSAIRIEACRFENVGSRAVNLGGTTGTPYFRPLDATFEAKDLRVEDCVFIGSSAPIAFVGVDGATVIRNTIYRPGKYVVRILQENAGERFSPCRNGVFERNLIVFDPSRVGMSTNVGPKTSPETFVFRDNAWVSTDGRGRRPRNEIREVSGTYDRIPEFVDEEIADLTQKPTSPTREFGAREGIATRPRQLPAFVEP